MKAAVVACLAAAAVAVGQTGKGSISGKVVGAKTRGPVVVALVTAVRSGLPPLAKSTKTGADGAFQVQGLADGRYSICVQGGEGYLDPCQWGGALEVVVGETGGAVGGVEVRVTEAAVVVVDLRDGQNLLGQRMETGRRPAVSLGVWDGKGLYHPARAVGQEAAGGEGPAGPRVYRYQIGAPREVDLVLELGSGDVRLGDAAGVALAGNGSRTAFRQAGAEAEGKRFTFTVVGSLR